MKQFETLFNRIFHYLDKNLPASKGYHNVEHTQYVMAKARLIANKENLSEAEIQLIEVAALYHDIGYVDGAKEHEERGCAKARHDLPGFGFTEDEVELICGMIRATKIPQNPGNKYDEILADADLYYLSSPQFEHFGNKLYAEFKHSDPTLTPGRWHHIQREFIHQHHYFTPYGKSVLEPLKRKNLALL